MRFERSEKRIGEGKGEEEEEVSKLTEEQAEGKRVMTRIMNRNSRGKRIDIGNREIEWDERERN